MKAGIVRRILGCLAFCTLLIAGLLTVNAQSSQAADRSEVTYKYGSHARQKLDAYWNPTSSDQPGVVIPANGVTVEAVPGASHGGALLDEPGMKDKVMAWIDSRVGA